MTTYRRKLTRRESHHKTHNQVLEDKPYQLSRLIKVMVAKVHSIFSHALVGLFIQIIEEGDGVLFRKCNHWYAKAGGVEVAHISNKSIPLVEGVPSVDN